MEYAIHARAWMYEYLYSIGTRYVTVFDDDYCLSYDFLRSTTTTLAATATNALASSTTATTTISGADKSSAEAATTGATGACDAMRSVDP